METRKQSAKGDRDMGQVKAIPEGYHTIIPHLVVRGAAEAIDFYKKAFGAVEVARMPTPDGKIMHAHLKIGDSHLFLVDEMPFPGGGKSPQSLGGASVALHLNVEDADAVFNRAVAAGATAKMPPADMFWGDRYGQLADPFGHEWSVATHKEDVSPEEMKKRMQAMFAQMKPGKH
jgi:PhnB protein